MVPPRSPHRAAQAAALGAPLPGCEVCKWIDMVVEDGTAMPPPLPVAQRRPEGFEGLVCDGTARTARPGESD